MPRKVSIILLFIITILAGSLTSFLSTRVTSAEHPYQVAVTRRIVNVLIEKLEGRVKLLEEEVEKLKQESEELKKSLTIYKAATGKELNELRKLVEDLSLAKIRPH